MGVHDRPLTSSPWTVVLQGTSIPYDSASLLDKLEYSLRVGGPAAERKLSQDDFIQGVASALSGAARHLINPDSLTRAGKLLFSVTEFIATKDRGSVLKSFYTGLPTDAFAGFLSSITQDKEVSSWFLGSLGILFGQRALAEVSSVDPTVVKKQKTDYIHAVASILASITDESVAAHIEEEDDAPVDMLEGTPLAPRSSVLQAASSLGYIPTVPDIGSAQPLNSGDEQLGRVLSGVAAFLTTDDSRLLFCSVKTTAGPAPSLLTALLDKEVAAPVQVYYQAVFCLWLLSFVGHHGSASEIVEVVSNSLEKAALPRRLTAVLREISSEKVVRISLATLRNILSMSPTLRKEMIGAGLVDALQSPTFRRLDDDEIRDDLGVLAEALENELASMSSFDVYKAEVLSGALEWTPAHRDEQFWRENVEKLERNQQEVLRCMVRLLHESSDETVLAVACNDLAQFIKFHPRGRAIAQSLGVKARLMELMVSGEGDVRRYALNCVQVLMIRWNRQAS